MKTSNFIAILFVLVILGGSFILEKPKNLLRTSVSNKVADSKQVDHFSVIVAQPGSKVRIMAPYPLVEYPTFSSFRDKRFYLPPSYAIRNDTLLVFPCSGKDEYEGDYFHCKRIRSIVGMKKSDIWLSYLQADTLNIKLNYSNLFANFDTRNKFLKQINILADSSRIDLRAVAFENVNLQISRSHLRLETSFVKSKVQGTLRNYSGLNIIGLNADVVVLKDSTCYSSQ
jgi:hypothetical protein